MENKKVHVTSKVLPAENVICENTQSDWKWEWVYEYNY